MYGLKPVPFNCKVRAPRWGRLPQRLKPHFLVGMDVRAEARTLQLQSKSTSVGRSPQRLKRILDWSVMYGLKPVPFNFVFVNLPKVKCPGFSVENSWRLRWHGHRWDSSAAPQNDDLKTKAKSRSPSAGSGQALRYLVLRTTSVGMTVIMSAIRLG